MGYRDQPFKNDKTKTKTDRKNSMASKQAISNRYIYILRAIQLNPTPDPQANLRPQPQNRNNPKRTHGPRKPQSQTLCAPGRLDWWLHCILRHCWNHSSRTKAWFYWTWYNNLDWPSPLVWCHLQFWFSAWFGLNGDACLILFWVMGSVWSGYVMVMLCFSVVVEVGLELGKACEGGGGGGGGVCFVLGWCW